MLPPKPLSDSVSDEEDFVKAFALGSLNGFIPFWINLGREAFELLQFVAQLVELGTLLVFRFEVWNGSRYGEDGEDGDFSPTQYWPGIFFIFHGRLGDVIGRFSDTRAGPLSGVLYDKLGFCLEFEAIPSADVRSITCTGS